MTFAELFVLSLGLSMDAFAVAICTGLSMKKPSISRALTVGLYFGIFQAVMPLIGYLLGSQFSDKIQAVDHWVAFILLGIIGAKMLIDSIQKPDCEEDGCSTTGEASLKPSAMLPLAIATSIDALAVGVTLAFLQVSILPSVSFIGITTFILSACGVFLGHSFGSKFKSKAEMTGGGILILMGAKILLEHTGIL